MNKKESLEEIRLIIKSTMGFELTEQYLDKVMVKVTSSIDQLLESKRPVRLKLLGVIND